MIFGTTAYSEAPYSAYPAAGISYGTPGTRIVIVSTEDRIYFPIDLLDREITISDINRMALSDGSNRITKSNLGLN